MSRITKYDPFSSWFAFPKILSDLDDTVSSRRGLKVEETDKDIILEAVVAGVEPKDVDIDIEDGVVTIQAEKSSEEKTKDTSTKTAYKYYYTCALSGGQWDKSKASVKNGVLYLTIPKSSSAKKQKIKVTE